MYEVSHFFFSLAAYGEMILPKEGLSGFLGICLHIDMGGIDSHLVWINACRFD